MALGKRLENAAAEEEGARLVGDKARHAERHQFQLNLIVRDIKSLLARIDRDIPLIQLAITASGETLSTSLPPGVSPSRLLQASTFLIVGDTQFANDPTRPAQIGPSFTLSLYMLFVGHSARGPVGPADPDAPPATPEQASREAQGGEEPYGIGEGERKPTWQEVMHKTRVRLCRTPMRWEFDQERGYCPGSLRPFEPSNDVLGRPDEFSYHIEIVEDLDDGRLHEDSENPSTFDDIPMAGIRESIPVHQISKIFYTDTGSILNIGNSLGGDNNPVLLLKRDANAPSPTQLRREWDAESVELEADGSPRAIRIEPDDQIDIDRQLRAESGVSQGVDGVEVPPNKPKWNLPRHLDPEWLALEIYAEDEDEKDDDDDGEGSDIGDGMDSPSRQLAVMRPTAGRDRSSVDSKLLEQIRNISIRSSPVTTPSRPSSRDLDKAKSDSPESFVARSPFGSITSSLSLMEMLIRLASLQEFQQTTHLAIPDHILTFFLEETSTTGLRGEERWKSRNEAKRRVGFDPYTDTPTR